MAHNMKLLQLGPWPWSLAMDDVAVTLGLGTVALEPSGVLVVGHSLDVASLDTHFPCNTTDDISRAVKSCTAGNPQSELPVARLATAVSLGSLLTHKAGLVSIRGTCGTRGHENEVELILSAIETAAAHARALKGGADPLPWEGVILFGCDGAATTNKAMLSVCTDPVVPDVSQYLQRLYGLLFKTMRGVLPSRDPRHLFKNFRERIIHKGVTIGNVFLSCATLRGLLLVVVEGENVDSYLQRLLMPRDAQHVPFALQLLHYLSLFRPNAPVSLTVATAISKKLAHYPTPFCQALKLTALVCHTMLALLDNQRPLRTVLVDLSTLAHLLAAIYERNNNVSSFCTGPTYYGLLNTVTATYYHTAVSMLQATATNTTVSHSSPGSGGSEPCEHLFSLGRCGNGPNTDFKICTFGPTVDRLNDVQRIFHLHPKWHEMRTKREFKLTRSGQCDSLTPASYGDRASVLPGLHFDYLGVCWEEGYQAALHAIRDAPILFPGKAQFTPPIFIKVRIEGATCSFMSPSGTPQGFVGCILDVEEDAAPVAAYLEGEVVFADAEAGALADPLDDADPPLEEHITKEEGLPPPPRPPNKVTVLGMPSPNGLQVPVNAAKFLAELVAGTSGPEVQARLARYSRLGHVPHPVAAMEDDVELIASVGDISVVLVRVNGEGSDALRSRVVVPAVAIILDLVVGKTRTESVTARLLEEPGAVAVTVSLLRLVSSVGSVEQPLFTVYDHTMVEQEEGEVGQVGAWTAGAPPPGSHAFIDATPCASSTPFIVQGSTLRLVTSRVYAVGTARHRAVEHESLQSIGAVLAAELKSPMAKKLRLAEREAVGPVSISLALDAASLLVRPEEQDREATVACGLCLTKVRVVKSGLYHHVSLCVLRAETGDSLLRHQVCGLCGLSDGICIPSTRKGAITVTHCGAVALRKNKAYFSSSDYNVPLSCPHCDVFVWRFNMPAHYAKYHSGEVAPAFDRAALISVAEKRAGGKVRGKAVAGAGAGGRGQGGRGLGQGGGAAAAAAAAAAMEEEVDQLEEKGEEGGEEKEEEEEEVGEELEEEESESEDEEEVAFAVGAVVTLKGLPSQGTIVAVYMVPPKPPQGEEEDGEVVVGGKPRLAYSVRFDSDPRKVQRDVLGSQLQAAPNGRRRRVVPLDFRALAGHRPN